MKWWALKDKRGRHAVDYDPEEPADENLTPTEPPPGETRCIECHMINPCGGHVTVEDLVRRSRYDGTALRCQTANHADRKGSGHGE